MQTIPITAVPSQTFNVVLGGQYCRINIYQKTTGVYLDLYVKGVLKMSAVVCRDRVRLVNRPYLGFVGDLAFVDLQGTSDPQYAGFGTRYTLVYLEAADV